MNNNFKPYEVSEGKEILLKNSSNGELYAGDWAVEQMNRDEDIITIGTYNDEVRGPHQTVQITKERMLGNKTLVTGLDNTKRSELFTNIATQIVQSNHSTVHVCTEETPEKLLKRVPQSTEDVIYINPVQIHGQGGAVGFNLLESPVNEEHEKSEVAVQTISKEFLELLKRMSDNWGPQIANITDRVVRQLTKADDPFNLIDFVRVMTDSEEREQLVENYEGDIGQQFIEQIAEQDQVEFDPILRRVRYLLNSRLTRMITSNDPGFNLYKAMVSGKTIIFDFSDVKSDPIRDMLATIVTLRLSIIDRILSTQQPFIFYSKFGEREEYTSKKLSDMNNMSIVTSIEKIGNYEKDTQSNLKDSTHRIAFNPGNDESEASRIALLYNTSADRLMHLEQNECVSHTVTKEGFVSDNALDTSIFYLPPPRRKQIDFRELTDDAVSQYGSDISKVKIEEYGPSRFIQ